jgi:hypothetical protein
MDEKKQKNPKDKKYTYGPGEQSNLSRAFRGIFPDTWLASEYGQRSAEAEEEPPTKQPQS